MIWMKQWIINADDFGYSKGVNYGIIEAFHNGIVSSTTLMVNMSGTKHAVDLAKKNQGLGVGIHFALTCGKPIRNDVPSLVDDKGDFLRLPDLESSATVADIEKELTSQLERFLSYGLTPTHLDSHHHVHTSSKVYPVFTKLANHYRLPIRNASNQRSSLQVVDYFCSEFYGAGLTVINTLALFEELQAYKTVEVMCHPAFLDIPLKEGSTYAMERLNELRILTHPAILSYLHDKEIQLRNYQTIA